MTVVKFNNRPIKGFNLMEDFFNELPGMYKDDTVANQNGFIPVNIKETPDAYLLEVVAPGLDKDNFHVNLEENILTISAGVKKEEKNDSDSNRNEKLVRREYSYRSFKRSFTLNEKIDGEKIEAKYFNGVLTLNLPKKAVVKASAKEISIQ